MYREAADLAYYFHWSRGDLFGMTGAERKRWLSEIRRIHREQKQLRHREVLEQAEQVASLRRVVEE